MVLILPYCMTWLSSHICFGSKISPSLAPRHCFCGFPRHSCCPYWVVNHQLDLVAILNTVSFFPIRGRLMIFHTWNMERCGYLNLLGGSFQLVRRVISCKLTLPLLCPFITRAITFLLIAMKHQAWWFVILEKILNGTWKCPAILILVLLYNCILCTSVY